MPVINTQSDDRAIEHSPELTGVLYQTSTSRNHLPARPSPAHYHGLAASSDKTEQWLIQLAGFIFVIGMHKYSSRDPLASGAGSQGIVEAGSMTASMLCVWLATHRTRRLFEVPLSSIAMACFGLLALASSWRSFSPVSSYAKGLLFLVVLSTIYMVSQSGYSTVFFKSLYRGYVALLAAGLAIGILRPSLYPLFIIDPYSGRMTMSVFSTPFDIVSSDTALMILMAPLIVAKPSRLVAVFLLITNVIIGSKTSTLLLVFLLTVRFIITTIKARSWYSRRTVGIIVAGMALTCFLVIVALDTAHYGSVLAKPAEALYGSRIGAEATHLDGRLDLWLGAIRLLPTVPFLGYGFEGDRALMLAIAPWAGHSHNVYLEMSLAAGLLAFTFLATALVSVGNACRLATSTVRLDVCLLLAFILADGLTADIFENPCFMGMLLIFWLPYRIMAAQENLDSRRGMLIAS